MKENEDFQKEWQRALVKALEYYPKIKKNEVILQFKKQKQCARCYPSIDFLYKSQNKRTYIIAISIRFPYKDFLQTLTFGEKLGWLGHELAHIIEYKSLTKLRLIRWLFKYITSTSFRINREYNTDKVTIKHGLGNELKAGVEKTLTSTILPEKSKVITQSEYMSPKEISEYQKYITTNRSTDTDKTLIQR